MSIRLQLLIAALTTLVLPWAGCQYARELETALRDAQEKSLLASAGTIANALSAQPQRVFSESGSRAFDASRGDLYVYALRAQPLLDGYRDDWGVAAAPASLPTSTGYGARLQAASTERYLYLYVEVDDRHFDPEPSGAHSDRDRFDRVDLTFQTSSGARQAYFFGTTAPGLIAAQSLIDDGQGQHRVVEEPRIQAYWLQTSAGYRIETRIPLSFIGERLWVEVQDGGGAGKAGVSAASVPEGGRLFFTTAGLDELLSTFVREGTRAAVSDANAWVLGVAGSLSGSTALDTREDSESWYRRWMAADTSAFPAEADEAGRLGGNSVAAALRGQPHAEWVRRADSQELRLTAAAPIAVDRRTRGVVFLEQAGDQLIALRDRAVTHLFNLTWFATGAAATVMLGFATWISLRIGRLRDAADSAVASDGEIRLDMPESGAGDEIGALARSFERLLTRLNEHTQYLRTLGAKLSHELRTPLTIVRSSLDNLESEGLREDQRRYVTRAREGTQRLQSILSALGAAARVEESIKQAERMNVDLRELLSPAVGGYRGGFPQAHILLEMPAEPCFIRGAPDLLVQLLDKLIENAVDFCPAGGAITVRLERAAGNYLLQVQNDGPPIPPALHERLFESLFEQRRDRDDKPHFGLGLYIVRLIAEFHGGTAAAANRSDGGGAVFTVTLPLI